LLLCCNLKQADLAHFKISIVELQIDFAFSNRVLFTAKVNFQRLELLLGDDLEKSAQLISEHLSAVNMLPKPIPDQLTILQAGLDRSPQSPYYKPV
jgi:hypothetical protein